jgi:UDP-N-acetylmuramoyl-tripeptide--D-alanyl-D-alanine ligase
MELVRTVTGALVLNDAYNANPTSMAAALRSLAELPARRRIAILGTMAELGRASHDAHAEIGDLARSLGIDVVVAVGEPAFGVAVVERAAEVATMLGRLADGDAVLVKGSRVAGLEVLAAGLVAAAGGPADGGHTVQDAGEGDGDAW